MVRLATFVVLLLLGACSKGPEADLEYIGGARSLAAEWAMVNDQAAHNRVSATYARTMRHDLREQLETTASSLTQPDSPYGREIRSLLKAADEASPAQLRGYADRLKRQEDALESA